MQHLRLKSSQIITTSLLIICVGIFSCASSLSAFAVVVPNMGPKVSFTFDDGLSSALLAADALSQYGYTGTEYVTTDCVGMKADTPDNTCAADTTKDYMSWEDLVTLQNRGWEIGSHSVSHPELSTLDAVSMDNEILQSQALLQSHGLNALNFATPFGDYNNNTLAVSAKYYNSFRTFQDPTFDDNTLNAFPYYYPHSIYPYNNYLLTVVPVQGDVSVATVQGYVDQAKANNQWLILVFHEIKADDDASYDSSQEAYEYTAGNLGAIAEYIQSQSVPVLNINDGLAGGINVMPNSGFNNGIADGWTTDSPSMIVVDQQATTQAGHGSFDGTLTGALNSIYVSNTSEANAHLFSPRISVVQGSTYTIKTFVNLISSVGEVDFYIDEYDVAGYDLKTGRYIDGIKAPSVVQVGNVNFTYTPSSASVASIRLHAIAKGVGTIAYVDNMELLSPDGSETVVLPPVIVLPGDLNGDGVVDALDLSVVLINWNLTGQTSAQGDLNGDGVVDALDLSTILINWSNKE